MNTHSPSCQSSRIAAKLASRAVIAHAAPHSARRTPTGNAGVTYRRFYPWRRARVPNWQRSTRPGGDRGGCSRLSAVVWPGAVLAPCREDVEDGRVRGGADGRAGAGRRVARRRGGHVVPEAAARKAVEAEPQAQ